MSDDKLKDYSMATPIENHETAAWADIENQKDIDKVSIPSKTSIRDAKDWVDSNQK